MDIILFCMNDYTLPSCNHRIFPNLLLPAPSQSRLRRVSSPKGRAKGRALPAQRIEISAQLIRWHRLRRGGAPRSESK